LEGGGGEEMSSTFNKTVIDRFQTWWEDEGKDLSQHLPVEAFAFTAWSNGAFVAISSKLELDDVHP
jgi:hypothetical protein